MFFSMRFSSIRTNSGFYIPMPQTQKEKTTITLLQGLKTDGRTLKMVPLLLGNTPITPVYNPLQYRPQYTIVFIIGTLKKGTPNFGKPPIYLNP